VLVFFIPCILALILLAQAARHLSLPLARHAQEPAVTQPWVWVYRLTPARMRLDTIASAYAQGDDTMVLCQRGHSKHHRPALRYDLAQPRAWVKLISSGFGSGLTGATSAGTHRW
jgi:hypothetical protein